MSSSHDVRDSAIDGVVNAALADPTRLEQLRIDWPVMYYALVRLSRWRTGGRNHEH